MKTDTMIMLGVAAIALYFFMSQHASGATQIAPNQFHDGTFPFGGYLLNGIYYEYDAQGVAHKASA